MNSCPNLFSFCVAGPVIERCIMNNKGKCALERQRGREGDGEEKEN